VSCTNEIRYPDIRVQLTGRDGNAFAILDRMRRALRGKGQDQIDEFTKFATSGDYDHLLMTCMEWVSVD